MIWIPVRWCQLVLAVSLDSKHVEPVGSNEGQMVLKFVLGMSEAANGDNEKISGPDKNQGISLCI